MKKQFLWAALAATTLLCTSCNNEEPSQKSEETEVTFIIGGINSRTTTNFNNLSANFDNGDKVGIFGTNLATTVNNAEFTYNGSTLTSSTSIKFTDANTEATFKAYYPYQAEASIFSVKSDQSTAANFNASDFLYATAKGKKGQQVALEFNHKMALIKLTIDEGFKSTLENATIESVILKAVPSATLDFTSENVDVTVSGTTTENIKMYNAEGTYYCIVPAQKITGDGSALLTITTSDNKAFAYKLQANSEIEFVEGKTLPITILDANSFKFYSVIINDWEDIRGDNWGVEEEEPEPETLLANQTFDNTTITSASNWTGSTGAWSFVAGTDAEVKITTEGDANNYALNLKSSEAVKNSWAQCVAYYTIENPKNTLYKISFKAKTDNAATKGLCFSALYKTTSNYVAIYNAPKNVGDENYYTGMIQCNVSTGNVYKEYSIIIDLTKTVTTRNNSAQTPTSTSDEDKKKIFITLYPATGGAANGVNFYVDDLKIEQIFSVE